MPSIELPNEALPDLKTITEIDQQHFDSLLKAMTETGPTLTRSRFQTSVVEKVETVSKSDIEAILRAAFNLYSLKLRSGLSTEEFVGAVTNSPILSKSSDFSQDKKKTLEVRLAQLMNCSKSIGVTLKARDVMTEHERVFCHARVLSDIRPVFANGLETASAGVIIHNLQLGFRHIGKHEEIYVALDTDDIKRLKEIIERAEKKTVALESILKASGLPYLKV
jgi:hypothetical protein